MMISRNMINGIRRIIHEHIRICDETMCDNGLVITNERTEDGKFVLEKCKECDGHGFKIRGGEDGGI